MQENKYELWVIFFLYNYFQRSMYNMSIHFLVHPPLHPHNSVHFKFCFLQQQRFIQLVLQLQLLCSLQA